MSNFSFAVLMTLAMALTATAERTLIGTFGNNGTIYTEPAPPPVTVINGTHTNTTEWRSLQANDFRCIPPGRNGPASGYDCSEIHGRLQNIASQRYTLQPFQVIFFEYISCTVGILNRDTCGEFSFTAGELAPYVNTMLQCPYNWGQDGVIQRTDPPVMMVLSGLDHDLPAYSTDSNCDHAHDELKKRDQNELKNGKE